MNNGHLGLLQKANLLAQTKRLAFVELTQKYKLNFCAVFAHNFSSLSIIESIGFDSVSICNSNSTLDFWNGITPEYNKIYSFSSNDNSIIKLLQFFSATLKDEINLISIYRTADYIFMLCNDSFNTEIITDFLKINFSAKLQKSISESFYNKEFIYKGLKLNISEAIESSVLQNIKHNNPFYEQLSKSVLKEVHNRLYSYFSLPHFIVFNNDFEASIIFASKKDIPSDLICYHLLSSLAAVIGENSSLLNLELSDSLDSFESVKSFLFD